MKKSARTFLAFFLAVVLAVTGHNGFRMASAAVKPKKIILSASTVLVKVNKKTTLKVTGVTPDKASRKVTYMVANKKIATVNSKGVIKGRRVGITTVKVVSRRNRRASANVKVIVAKSVPTKVTLSKKTLSLMEGTSRKLTATVKPSKVKKANRAGTWTTSNREVADVDQKGNVTAKREGTAKITFTTLNKKKAVCNLTVKAISLTNETPVPSATPNHPDVTTGPSVTATAEPSAPVTSGPSVTATTEPSAPATSGPFTPPATGPSVEATAKPPATGPSVTAAIEPPVPDASDSSKNEKDDAFKFASSFSVPHSDNPM